jgi:hypothetical protein
MQSHCQSALGHVMPRWHTMPRREERQNVDGKDNELNVVLV